MKDDTRTSKYWECKIHQLAHLAQMCAQYIQSVQGLFFPPSALQLVGAQYFVSINGDIMRGCISPNIVIPHFKFKLSNMIK